MLQIYAYDGIFLVRLASAVRVLSPQANAAGFNSLERVAWAEGGKPHGYNAGFVSFDFHVDSFFEWSMSILARGLVRSKATISAVGFSRWYSLPCSVTV